MLIIVLPASLGRQILGVVADEGQHPDIGVGFGHLILLMRVAPVLAESEDAIPAAQKQHVDVGVIEPFTDVVELATVGGHDALPPVKVCAGAARGGPPRLFRQVDP